MIVINDRVVMERPYWRNEEILAEVQGLDLTQVVDFGIEQLLNGSGTTLLCFGHGNVDAMTVCMYEHTLSPVYFCLHIMHVGKISQMGRSRFLL